MNEPFTYEELDAALRYDKRTGHLYWKINTGTRARAGTLAGYFGGKYPVVVYGGVSMAQHRVVWLLHYGVWPTGYIDHRDLNRHNNKINNLRDATASQNRMNCPARAGVQYKGVHKKKGKWVASINSKHIGQFSTPEDAARAYNAAATELFGEYARLNCL